MPPKEDLNSLRGYLLLEATDAGKLEDTMQMMVHGDNTITTTINATAITGLQELEQYTLTYEQSWARAFFYASRFRALWRSPRAGAFALFFGP